MKIFAIFALVALAAAEPEAEADPQYVVPTMYHHAAVPQMMYHHGGAHASAGLVQHANGAVVPDETPSVKAAKASHLTAKAVEYANKYAYSPYVASSYYMPAAYRHFYKREAEADPQYFYNKYYNTAAYTAPVVAPVTTAYTVPAVKPVVAPVTTSYAYNPYTVASSYYAPANYMYGNTYRHFYKREADSEPEAQYYNSYYNTHAYNYNPYTYANSYYAPAAYRYGYRHFYKREAEAEPEADPQYFYNKYYNTAAYTAPVVAPVTTAYTVPAVKPVVAPVTTAYTYSPYTVGSSYYAPANYMYGNTYRHFFKREADSEPEAQYYNSYYNTHAYNYNPYTYANSYYAPAAYRYGYRHYY